MCVCGGHPPYSAVIRMGRGGLGLPEPRAKGAPGLRGPPSITGTAWLGFSYYYFNLNGFAALLK